MFFWLQVWAIIRKNFINSFRNRELFVEAIIPIVVSLMLALKPSLGIINAMLPIIYALATFATGRSIMINLVEEKAKRYKEAQKIMGITNSAYTLGWLITAYVRVLMSFAFFEVFCQVSNSIFNLDWNYYYEVPFSDMLVTYLIFCFATIHQAFFFASIFNEAKIAGEVTTFFCVALIFLVYFTLLPGAANSLTYYVIVSLFSPQANMAFSYVTCLSPFSVAQKPTPLHPFVQPTVGNLNIFPSPVISETYNNTQCIGQLIGSTFLYFIMFLYFDQVMPNEYGISKHPLFFLQYFKKTQTPQSQSVEAPLLKADLSKDVSSAKYHQQIQMKQQPSITIQNLYKEFGQMTAVNGLTLYLYESEIFCLLGHNGAGKTTTISLLTGMIKKTSGDVEMYGMSLDKQLAQIRNSLGLCTQKDCLYDYLSIEEHLKFIGGIKGGISDEEISNIIAKAELTSEREKLVHELSGGSKRKLSLAMALVGNSKIIFLDEPTSGMDAYSRRSIWKILEKIRLEERTIILTTHHLDEAEILADRIGIMSRGELLAVGTSDFIKKKFGEGYNLKLTYEEGGHDTLVKLIDFAKHFLPEASQIPEQTSEHQLALLVPFSEQRKLATFFEKIEEIEGIKIGMQMNTLEDAFINIGLEEEKFFLQHQEELMLEQASISESSQEETKDVELTYKNVNKKYQNLIQSHLSDKQQSEELNVPACLKNPPNYKFSSQWQALFQRRFYTTIRTNTNYIALLIPLLTFLLGLIVVKYMVFPGALSEPAVQNFLQAGLLASVGVIGFSFNSTLYITLPVMEKELQLKQVLRGMGCRILPYWIGTFSFDVIVYCSLILFYFIVAFTLNLQGITEEFWKTLLVLTTFGYSYITFSYFCGFIFNSIEKALKLFAIFNFFVVFCLPFMLVSVLTWFYNNALPENQNKLANLIYFFQGILMILSPFWCYFQSYSLIPGSYIEVEQSIEIAGPIIIQTYWPYTFIMIGQGLVYSFLVWYSENRSRRRIIFKKDCIALSLQTYIAEFKNVKLDSLEQDVKNEYARVMDQSCEDSVIAMLLRKQYSKNGSEVLQSTTFGVAKGQILGIIGPNGAGKSTILNIMTGLTKRTAGMATISEKDVQLQDMNIAQHIGICSQFDCIWENLTPREHLKLFGRMKGLEGSDLEIAVNYFIKTMQLDLFVKTKAGRLSGGNKRKLCVADALIGGSDITFFDEPSTGVDPISRRFLFNTLKRNVQLRNCSVIMTTHTIEEAEQLSDRIGQQKIQNNDYKYILIVGQFMCIGSPEYLRKTYGSGYQITVKVFRNEMQQQLANSIITTFPNSKQIDDKRNNFLTFSFASEQFSFFKTFKFFDQKNKENIVEEFSITERSKKLLLYILNSSLESIFIHFSKVQQEKNMLEGLKID